MFYRSGLDSALRDVQWYAKELDAKIQKIKPHIDSEEDLQNSVEDIWNTIEKLQNYTKLACRYVNRSQDVYIL